MEYSLSIFKNLSLTQTLFKRRFNDTRQIPRHDWEFKYCVYAKVCPHKVSVNEGKDAS
jgi:CRISPR-associated exonuclease Cas4